MERLGHGQSSHRSFWRRWTMFQRHRAIIAGHLWVWRRLCNWECSLDFVLRIFCCAGQQRYTDAFPHISNQWHSNRMIEVPRFQGERTKSVCLWSNYDASCCLWPQSFWNRWRQGLGTTWSSCGTLTRSYKQHQTTYVIYVGCFMRGTLFFAVNRRRKNTNIRSEAIATRVEKSSLINEK